MVESEDNKRGRIHRHGDGCELYSSDCTTISIQSAIARFSPGNSVPPLALFDQEASRRGGDRQQKSPLGFSLSLSLSSKILSSLLSQILKSPRAPSRITNNSLFPVSFRPFLQFLSRKKKIKGERKNQAIMRGGRSIRFLRSHAFLRLFHYTITQLPMFYRSRIPQSGYYFFH